MTEQQYKRNIAYKFKVGSILSGKPVMEADRLKMLEIGEKQVVRVNLIANIIDKYVHRIHRPFWECFQPSLFFNTECFRLGSRYFSDCFYKNMA